MKQFTQTIYVLLFLLSVSFSMTAVAETATDSIDKLQNSNPENTEVWNFIATLDGDPIGTHRFQVSGNKQESTVTTNAKFDIKFLFITVYSYSHSNDEKWLNNCLISLDSKTDDNGDLLNVNLKKVDGKSIISTQDTSIEAEGCTRSFAYWNPDLLNSGSLLNSQTGEIINIDFSYSGTDSIELNGDLVTSDRYQLRGKDKAGIEIEIDLWYTKTKHWIGLKSKLENGRYIRYHLDSRKI